MDTPRGESEGYVGLLLFNEVYQPKPLEWPPHAMEPGTSGCNTSGFRPCRSLSRQRWPGFLLRGGGDRRSPKNPTSRADGATPFAPPFRESAARDPAPCGSQVRTPSALRRKCRFGCQSGDPAPGVWMAVPSMTGTSIVISSNWRVSGGNATAIADPALYPTIPYGGDPRTIAFHSHCPFPLRLTPPPSYAEEME